MSETIRHFEVAWETGSRRLSKCIVGLFWGTISTPQWKCVPQNGPTMHLTTISTWSPAQPQSGELLHYFPPPWWHEVHIFPTLTPVAQVAITVCIFPRKRAPVARFTALNNLPFHHGSPAIEPCYKFPCASNRLHIAPWHWAHVFCFVLYYWAARKGNFQSRITFYLCRRKTKWRTELPEGFAYPTTLLPPASMGPISAGRGRVISGRLANRFGSRFKVTRPSFFGGVPSSFEALWYPHLYFYRKSNT